MTAVLPQDVELSARWIGSAGSDGLEWLAILVGIVGLVIATAGAVTGASLLVYSPSKLVKRLKNGKRARVVPDLQACEEDYQVLARCTGLAGLLVLVTGVLWLTDFVPWWGIWAAITAIVFGVLPAALAERRAEAIVVLAQPFLRALRAALRVPVIIPLRATVQAVLRAVGIRDVGAADRDEIAEDIMAAVEDSATENALEDAEKAWLGNILELKEVTAGEAMTPRTDMQAIDGEASVADAVKMAIDSGYSRYPVYRERIDEVVGVFYAKDALRVGQSATDDTPPMTADMPVAKMMRKPLFVPENTSVVELLEQFKASKVQLAVVLDEYGGTAGLITIEDIIEEIVGDISDEYDSDEEASVKVVEEGRVVEVSARERVEDVNECLGIDLPEEGDYDTIAGFVFAELGRIPKVGESFHCHGAEFRILSGDDRRLGRLRVIALESQDSAAES